MRTSTRPLALVTGASSGIGYELARLFAADGNDVLITATGANDGLTRTAEAVRACDVDAIIVEADLITLDGVETLVDAVANTGRPLASAALNAGVDVGGYFVGGTDLAAELSMIQLHISSQVHLTKRLLPAMVERGSGALLYTASISGTMPTPFEAVYGGTKAFLISFVEAIKEENKDTGVTFTLLMPGEVDTNFWHRAGMDTSALGLGKKAAPTTVAKEGYNAMLAGRDRVVAGKAGSKFIGRVLNTVRSDAVNAASHAAGAKPGSGIEE